jgi:Flp pilus assembly protein TadD
MLYMLLRASLIILAIVAATIAQTATPELVSPLGVKFYAQPDEKGEIEQAKTKLAADPKNIELIIALGRAQATAWRYNDAIATYTRGIEIDPSNAFLYRHRGHRYISTRRFDKAIADLERAARLNDKDFDIWYHLGLAYYLTGQFERAASAYEKCRAVAEKDDSVIAISDWLYMTYRRSGRKAEADRVLDRITPDMKVEENKSYFDRLLLYKGLKKEDEILRPDLTDLELATVGYGIANWRYYNGDRAGAEGLLRKIVAGKYWPAFGFIAAEAELARMK